LNNQQMILYLFYAHLISNPLSDNL